MDEDKILTLQDLMECTPEQRNEYRYKCQTDLYFLSNNVLRSHKAKPLLRRVHGGICDTLIHKYPTSDFGYDPGFKPAIIKPFEEWSPIKERVILSSRGTLKALDLDTLIPTPNGFCRMGDLKLGDEVFDISGRPTKIIEVSPVYENSDCYDVEFSTGEHIVADKGHLWITETKSDAKLIRENRGPKVRSTEEIQKSIFVGTRKERNHRIATVRLIGEYKRLLIPPYVLGAWLGDGESASSDMTIADAQIAKEFQKEGEFIRPANNSSPYEWHCTSGEIGVGGYRNKHSALSLNSRLRILGLYKNKHIPTEYLRASIQQRTDLLQGLMDTDGTCSKRDGQCVFSNTNKVLIRQVRQLVASLGFKPSKIGRYISHCNGKACSFEQFAFKPFAEEIIPFRLKRKADLVQPKAKTALLYRQIVNITPVGTRPMRCISVDSPTHSYLVGDSFIPTHNSTIEAADVVQIILCEPNIRVILMSGKLGLAKSILRMARGYFESNEVIQALFPQFCDQIQINANEFTSPARHGVNYRDPTVQVATFGSTKAGIHGEYIKLDDATNEVNQATPELVEKSIQEYDDLDPLLEPGGYIDFTATRWAVDDLPEYIRVKGEEMEAETGRKHVQYFFQPIWKVKKVDDPNLSPHQVLKLQFDRDEREKKHMLIPDDVELLWPEKLTAEYLWPKYRKNFRKFSCFPAGCSVLTADWTEKPIEKLQVGDDVVGFKFGIGGKANKTKFVKAKVEYVHSEESEVWKVETNFGRIFYTTPDHKFLRIKQLYNTNDRYGKLSVGTRIVPVYSAPCPKTEQEKLDLAWLGGILDGEGSCTTSPQITQSVARNPDVCAKIESVLTKLNISYETWENKEHGAHKCARVYTLHGGRSLKVRLLTYGQMAKRNRFIRALWRQSTFTMERFHGVSAGHEHVKSIESVGKQIVYNIQSSSGNFICQGVAVKNCQYLLNPEGAASGVFTHSLLVRQTRPISECPMPHRSITCINWDLAGISGKGDFAVGIVGVWEDTGRLFIIDAIIEKFRSSTDICNAIVGLFKKYNPDFHRIESANGSELLSGELRRIAEEADLDRAFHPGWDPPTNEENAKVSRIMLLPGALEKNLLQFFSGIPNLPELYKQFEKFAGGKGKYKDDGPDCVAQLYQKWRGMIGPKAISYVTPSGAVIDFQSPLQVEQKDVDPHADERLHADIDFLQNFTCPSSGV